MTNVAALKPTPSQPATGAEETAPLPLPLSRSAIDYMGPARVLSVELPQIMARRSDGREVLVQMALPIPYVPNEGDVLLLVGGQSGHYALGVLHGSGKGTLAIAGDMDVHAVGGTLNLTGDKGVQLHGKEVEVVSDKLKIIAGAAVQKVTTLVSHVRELWSVKAKSAHLAVKDDYYQRSKNATLLTEEVVSVNGKQIHLG